MACEKGIFMAATNRQASPVDFRSVVFRDRFWRPRLEAVRTSMLPYQWRVLNDRVPGVPPSYAVRNFEVVTSRRKGKRQGPVFQDCDFYKWLEGACDALAAQPTAALRRLIDRSADLIAAAQEPDGYLNTAFTGPDGKERRWTNLGYDHELFLSGMLMEAAVAHHRATGSDKLIQVAARNAECIMRVLGRGRGKKRGYPGHPGIEMSLLKMYRATGDKKYLDLCTYFVDERGRKPSYLVREGSTSPGQLENSLAHKPVREHSKAVGHAVRATYLYTAMADLAMETGDDSLFSACQRLWKNLTTRRMHVTGGVGSAQANEGFTNDYDLPNEDTYCETCASIGLIFWAHRMFQADPRGEYYDVLELALYNTFLASHNLDGTEYFYANRLAFHPSQPPLLHPPRRVGWMDCACCPPNILRVMTTLGQYVYSVGKDTIYVNLYAGSETRVALADRSVTLIQDTAYPWRDRVTITVRPDKASQFTLALRIPGWCRGAKLSVNGKAQAMGKIVRHGLARVRRRWQAGDKVELVLPMPPERLEAHPAVRQTCGRVALRRGPVVYCLEQADNGPDLQDLALSDDLPLTLGYKRLFGQRIPVIRASAMKRARREWSDDVLYRPAGSRYKRVAITAVPYFLWANRDPGEMLVWIRSNSCPRNA